MVRAYHAMQIYFGIPYKHLVILYHPSVDICSFNLADELCGIHGNRALFKV